MKMFWAIVKLHEDETAQDLLAAMFDKEEFNPQNAILIQDGMAILEIFFDQAPPRKIAEAIGGYSEVRCGFGKVSKDCLLKGGLSPAEVYPQKESENTDEAPAQFAEEPVVVAEAPTIQNSEDEGSGKGAPQEVVTNVGEEDNITNNSGKGGAEKTEPTTEPTEAPTAAPEDIKNKQPKAKENKPKRKAPDAIPEIDEIAKSSKSYPHFVERIIKWLEAEKRTKYLMDVFDVAAKVEKVGWDSIEEELTKRGYKTPRVIRTATSREVTANLGKQQLDISFIALVQYVAKYKSFNFQANIEAQVMQILDEMGIKNEPMDIQTHVTRMATAAVMVEPEDANIKGICIAAGYGRNEDVIEDAQMDFSSFINEFLEKHGKEMMSAENFLIKLREAIFNRSNIW